MASDPRNEPETQVVAYFAASLSAISCASFTSAE